jgi:hypothetical protein
LGVWVPGEGIERKRRLLAERTNEDIVAILDDLPGIPEVDDGDPYWDDASHLEAVELLLALADEVGERRLTESITGLFVRAALGDVFGAMQGIRHGPEKAVAPDFGRLAVILRPLAQHERAGCRRWSIRELGILRDRAASDVLKASLDDPVEEVRREARRSLQMLEQG